MQIIMRLALFALCIVLVTRLAGCGGGGSQNDSTFVNYVGAAAAGELLNFNVDIQNRKYEYTFTESQFNLKNLKSSGQLIENLDGSFTQTDGNNSRLQLSSSGFLVGVVTADLLIPNQRSLFFGATNPSTIQSDIIGYYNFISRNCTTNINCTADYGSLEFKSDNSWELCTKGNLSANPKPTSLAGCEKYESGTYQRNGSGWDLQSVESIGTVIFKKISDDVALIIDWRDNRVSPIFNGNGFAFGKKQNYVSFPNTGATWIYQRYSTDGSYSETTVNDSGTVTSGLNTFTIYPNDPWIGFSTPKTLNGTPLTTSIRMNDAGIGFSINRSPGSSVVNLNIQVGN